jgi:hypothetical protein
MAKEHCRSVGSTRVLLGLCLVASACTGYIDKPDLGFDGRPSNEVAASHRLPQRLSNREYNHTLRDLLGTELRPAETFVAEESMGFDHIAEALGATATQLEGYIAAAERVVADTFADDARRARIVTCDVAAEEGCLHRIVADFGLRAWRRPLEEPEVAALVALRDDALALGATSEEALQHVISTMLVSPSFLYRIEVDPDPEATKAHPLGSYELASRLSYFLWATMPDDELFALAATDELLEDDVLEAQIDRMLDDPRVAGFIDGFVGQWLGTRNLASHRVLPEYYPEWDAELQRSMSAEAGAFYAELLLPGIPIDSLLTADLHFVDERLAAHYGLSGVTGDELVRVEDAGLERRGVFGLGAVLTVTSYSHRTSPTLRAKWVLTNLLCSPPSPPPPGLSIPDLDGDAAANEAAALDNIRERLALHRTDPQCAGCHNIMDPIGFAFERFDAIGGFRTEYPNGDVVDATGELPSGEYFDGAGELAEVVRKSPLFEPCVVEKLLVYALGRRPQKGDRDTITALHAGWIDDGLSLSSLVRRLVLSDAFRSRLPVPADQSL